MKAIKILLIGSGGREHAIAKALKQSPQLNSLFCFAEYVNPGIKKLCVDYQVGHLQDLETIGQWAVQQNIDFAIIGPEAPLAAGLTDFLETRQIAVVGPCKLLAQIETSKSFTRDLLQNYEPSAIPRYKKFTTLEGVNEFLQCLGDNFVVKADGLMGGKGVKVAKKHLLNHAAALDYCRELYNNQHSFLLEEKLIGQEFSLLSFSDGQHLIHMPVVKDYKCAFAGDTGPNTGGMGSYSDRNHILPFLSMQDVQRAQYLNEITVRALLQKFGRPYKGILYGCFMLTQDGAIKLIEYNARFGDPEAINILSLLQSDLISICQAIINGTLHKMNISFTDKATVCKYLVPAGYPNQPIQNAIIDIAALENQDNLYYAAAKMHAGQLYTTSSRSLAVLGIADSLETAEKQAEFLIRKIRGPVFYREDIGKEKCVAQEN